MSENQERNPKPGATLKPPPGVKLLRTLEGHRDSVISLAFDPKGEALASGGWDNTVKLWETQNGKLLQTLEGHQSPVSSVAFDPKGGTLASGGADKTVRIWDARSGKLLRTLEGHQSWVRSVAYDPQGSMLASGSDDQSVKLCEAQTDRLLRRLERHKGSVLSVAFDPQGTKLASGGSDNTVKLWEARNGKLLRTLEGHTNIVDVVAFSPDGRLLASKSDDDTIRLWSSETWETVAVMPEPKSGCGWIPALAFHPMMPRRPACCWMRGVKPTLWRERRIGRRPSTRFAPMHRSRSCWYRRARTSAACPRARSGCRLLRRSTGSPASFRRARSPGTGATRC